MSISPAEKAIDVRRTEPSRDVRRLVLYSIGLVIVYVLGVWLLRPTAANGNSENWAVVVMAAPTAGALLARFAGPGVIVWGRPNWWLIVGLAPVAVGLACYLVAAAFGVIGGDGGLLTTALAAMFLTVPAAMISATGEEIGWRGFLWPLVRRRLTFVPAWLVVTVIWWLYHVPVVLLGWYGSLGGLPAFTVAIFGFGAFVSVLTDRSRSIWPSVVAHGAWNATVATSFAVEDSAAFTGDPALLGEFGWIAAIGMVLMGAVATVWHLATGGSARTPYPARLSDPWTADAQISR
jgi:membrane protease YdiL (CAAX protease family)